jgi:Spy/CpxP family protein refolding chaperone
MMMKSLKVAAIALPLLIGGVGCSNTSADHGTEPNASAMSARGERHMSPVMMPLPMLKEKLGLSDDQVTKIEGIRTAFRTSMEQRREANKGLDRSQVNRDSMRALFEASRAQIETQVKAVLTPDQQAKLATLVAEMPQRPTPEQMAARRDSMLSHMKAELNLSDAQVQQIKDLQAKMMANAPKPGDRPEWNGREGHNGDRKEFRGGGPGGEKFREALKSILTPAQLTKLDSLHAARAKEHGQDAHKPWGDNK